MSKSLRNIKSFIYVFSKIKAMGLPPHHVYHLCYICICMFYGWPVPRTVAELQRFLWFVNFYRDFIRGISDIGALMMSLLKYGAKSLYKIMLLKQHPSCIIPTQKSRWWKLLKQEWGLCYFSKKLPPAEVSYVVSNCELLTVKLTIEECKM